MKFQIQTNYMSHNLIIKHTKIFWVKLEKIKLNSVGNVVSYFGSIDPIYGIVMYIHMYNTVELDKPKPDKVFYYIEKGLTLIDGKKG